MYSILNHFREWSPFGLDLLSATKQSKTLALSGIDLFDTSLTETVSSHSKKFFKEARSLSSLSSPGPSDLIQLKQPASINTDRSSTKYRDLFNSSTEKIDTKLPFQDVADDGVKSRSSLTRYRSKQEEIDDLGTPWQCYHHFQ